MCFSTLNEALNSLKLSLVDQRSHQCRLSVRITRALASTLHRGFVPLHELVVDALLYVHTAGRKAHLPRVCRDGIAAPSNGVLQVTIVKHNSGTLAAEFERDTLQVGLGSHLLDTSPRHGRAREADFADLHVAREQGARAAVAGEDLEHAWWEAGLLDESAESKGGEWGLLGGLEDESVACRESRAGFHTNVGRRSIPGNDAGAHAQGLIAHNLEEAVLLWIHLAGELVREAGKVTQGLRRDTNLKLTKGCPWGAERHAGKFREGVAVGLDEVGETEQAVTALLGRGLAPRLEGRPGGGNGGLNILLTSEGDVIGD